METISFFKYFYNLVADAVGEEEAGAHFIAITVPGSDLEKFAKRYGFKATLLNNPNIGGRYSALSHFGVVPAALIGAEVTKLLDEASTMAHNCDGYNSSAGGDNRGAWLGAIMGELAAAGRDKVTLLASPPLAPFGPWIEQLITESTGKEGTGVLPVEGESVGSPASYGDDRLRIYEKMLGDPNLVQEHRYPHNIALLRDVRREGYPTALATQSHREQARRVLDILGLADEFDVIVTRDDVEHGKPDPEMHLLAARELGVGPEECLAIEDSPAGVRAALAADMEAIAVTTGLTRQKFRDTDLLDRRWVVDDPRMLSTVLRRRLCPDG